MRAKGGETHWAAAGVTGKAQAKKLSTHSMHTFCGVALVVMETAVLMVVSFAIDG